MRIIKPMVIVEDDLAMLMPNGVPLAAHMAKKIEMAARKCYKSEGRMTEDSYQKFLPGVFSTKRHTGIAEHRVISVTFITDRGVSHEGVRHRMAAYLQESTRYCDYSGTCKKCGGVGQGGGYSMLTEQFVPCPECPKHNGVTYILPPWVKPNDHSATYTPWRLFKAQLHQNEKSYQEARADGWPPEQARGFLAHFVKTEYFASLNLGSWWNFFAKRTAEAAHPQMRQLAIPLLRYFRQHLPMFFDSVPYQSGHAKLGLPEDWGTFMHKGVSYPEAKLIVNPYYDQVSFEEVYAG
jgi:thymidylate synthase (FAD)